MPFGSADLMKIGPQIGEDSRALFDLPPTRAPQMPIVSPGLEIAGKEPGISVVAFGPTGRKTFANYYRIYTVPASTDLIRFQVGATR